MKLHYYVQSSPDYYSEETDETFCDEEYFDYEPNEDDLEEALSKIIYEDYFDKEPVDKNTKIKIMQFITKFINNLDIKKQALEFYEEYLIDYFKKEAMEAHYE